MTKHRFSLGLLALFATMLAQVAPMPALAQGISQKVAVCNPDYTGRCIKPDANGAVPVTGSLTPSGTQDTNLKQVNGATVNVGAGAAGTGTQRVTTSTDSTIATVGAVTAITNALPAGAAILGKVGIDQTTPGTTNAVSAQGVDGAAAVHTIRTDTIGGTLQSSAVVLSGALSVASGTTAGIDVRGYDMISMIVTTTAGLNVTPQFASTSGGTYTSSYYAAGTIPAAGSLGLSTVNINSAGVFLIPVNGAFMRLSAAGSGTAAVDLYGLKHGTPSLTRIQGAASTGQTVNGDPVLQGLSDGTAARNQRGDTNGFALNGIVTPGTPISAASGNVANASAAATLAGAASKTTYITGFQCTASGATAASVVNLTVAGLISGTATYTFVFPAGATALATPLIVPFSTPVPASATNTSIVVTLPAGGAGNTNAACSAQGFQL